MERTVWLESKNGLERMVVLEDGHPVELSIAQAGDGASVGDLFMGRVETVVRGMQAAFVDIGDARNAFLPLAEAILSDVRGLRPGDEILVQVARAGEGEKGARLTMRASFPGKYAVLMPAVDTVGVSRHIEDETTRARLTQAAEEARQALQGAGVVIRTAAEGVPVEAIRAEIEALCAEWAALAQRAHARKAPARVHSVGGLEERATRDLDAPITRGDLPPEIESKLEKALRRKVWLPGGGYLVIDACEAMTVVDVNSGKFTGKKNLAETLLALNIEAARECARQIRLRDIGGIIIVDFADMETNQAREAVLTAFQEALAPDRAKRHVHGFTGAGLLEMTRRSLYGPVRDALFMPCPHCHGEGAIPRRSAHREGNERTP